VAVYQCLQRLTREHVLPLFLSPDLAKYNQHVHQLLAEVSHWFREWPWQLNQSQSEAKAGPITLWLATCICCQLLATCLSQQLLNAGFTVTVTVLGSAS